MSGQTSYADARYPNPVRGPDPEVEARTRRKMPRKQRPTNPLHLRTRRRLHLHKDKPKNVRMPNNLVNHTSNGNWARREQPIKPPDRARATPPSAPNPASTPLRNNTGIRCKSLAPNRTWPLRTTPRVRLISMKRNFVWSRCWEHPRTDNLIPWLHCK